MSAVARLRRDHQSLRAKLSVIETTFAMKQDAWYVLRELFHSLTRQLRDHIRREEELMAYCRGLLAEQDVPELFYHHSDEAEQLRLVNRLFVEAGGHSIQTIRPRLRGFVRALRAHMEDEERDVFPMLERILTTHPRSEAAEATGRAGSSLRGSMSIGEIVAAYPETRDVFERMLIHIEHEGGDHLDEVAWRHGVSSGQLIKRLELRIRRE